MPSPFPNLPPDQRGTVHTLRLASSALAGNPWGDPSERDLHVYTPVGYDGTDARYPVLLVLAPFSGTGEKLLARGLSDVSIATRFDRLIRDGCPPFVAVLPDCMTSLVGSQYRDSAGLGAYGTYVAREVRAYVEDHFRTTGRWGVLGRSSGGFGALSLAMDFPGAFRAVASHAGDMGFDLAYLGDLSAAVAGVRMLGGLEGFVEAFWDLARPPGPAFAAMNILCMACAYSPDPEARPLPARLPVDFETGAVDFDVLRSWQRHDPILRAEDPAAQEALRRLDLLFLDAGDRDEYHLHLGLRRFVARLRAAEVPHVHEEFPGGHRGTNHRYDVSIPRLVAAMSG